MSARRYSSCVRYGWKVQQLLPVSLGWKGKEQGSTGASTAVRTPQNGHSTSKLSTTRLAGCVKAMDAACRPSKMNRTKQLGKTHKKEKKTARIYGKPFLCSVPVMCTCSEDIPRRGRSCLLQRALREIIDVPHFKTDRQYDFIKEVTFCSHFSFNTRNCVFTKLDN